MSWKSYLKYVSLDGKSRGYHNIPTELTDVPPVKCPFGHPIKGKIIVVIDPYGR
jgi:hypothetical protein